MMNFSFIDGLQYAQNGAFFGLGFGVGRMTFLFRTTLMEWSMCAMMLDLLRVGLGLANAGWEARLLWLDAGFLRVDAGLLWMDVPSRLWSV